MDRWGKHYTKKTIEVKWGSPRSGNTIHTHGRHLERDHKVYKLQLLGPKFLAATKLINRDLISNLKRNENKS